jgi:hypothetical protein
MVNVSRSIVPTASPTGFELVILGTHSLISLDLISTPFSFTRFKTENFAAFCADKLLTVN